MPLLRHSECPNLKQTCTSHQRWKLLNWKKSKCNIFHFSSTSVNISVHTISVTFCLWHMQVFFCEKNFRNGIEKSIWNSDKFGGPTIRSAGLIVSHWMVYAGSDRYTDPQFRWIQNQISMQIIPLDYTSGGCNVISNFIILITSLNC